MEEGVKKLMLDVEKIMTNHLPHLQISLTRLEERMKLVLWVLAIIGAAVIANLFK